MEQTQIHPLTQSDTISSPKALVVFFVMVVLGVTVGFGAVKLTTKKTVITDKNGQTISNGTSAGVTDKTTFKDKAEGTLREGGIEGEGSFHLERPGGADQNVYLTSTTVDLTPFVGKNVRVWGQTFSGQKAGWLMDVGSVETI